MSASPAVIVISSHVAKGAVGNRAAVFALEALGFSVCAVPTVILPWHPGHGTATRIVSPAQDFAALLADLAGAPWLAQVRGLLSGYLGAADQAGPVAALARALKTANPDALYICDPVTGDERGLYVPAATAEAMRDTLLPLADIVTPNRFELDWFAGSRSASNTDIVQQCAALGLHRALVTSAHPMMADATANLLAGTGGAVLAEHRRIDGAPHGPGDLTAALFLARLLAGDMEETALEKATAAVFEVIARSVKTGDNELALAREADRLKAPMAMVQMRRLAGRPGKRSPARPRR